MAVKKKTFTLLSFIFTIATLVSIIISFASDRWVVSTETQTTGFKNLGLWSACFEHYQPPAYATVTRYFDGCWWVLDKEMDDLRFYLFPGWFVGTQVLVTLGLVLQLIALITMVVNVINCFPESPYRRQISIGLSLTIGVLHSLTAIFLMVAVILFGARADNDGAWLEKPDQNYLSWSFGLCILAAFLAILSMMCQMMEFCRLRVETGMKDEPRVYLTNQPPPSTNYAYSRQSTVTTYAPGAPRSSGHPAYSSRYSTHGSQSSINTKPPDTMFAVSGAGEVYINGLADFDENRQRGRNGYPYQEKRPLDSRNYADNVDYRRNQNGGDYPTKPAADTVQSRDYTESRQTKQPVLPEYVPKPKNEKMDVGNTTDDSYISDEELPKKKALSDSEEDQVKDKKRSKSESKSKKGKSRSDSEKRKKKGGNTDDEKHSKRKSKKRGDKSDASDDERSRSRRKSKKGNSPSTRRRSSRSRDRSKSRDLNSSYSESDAGSTRSRSRHRHKDDKDFSRKDKKRRSASEDNLSSRKDKHRQSSSDKHKKKKDYYTDETGSEYSVRRKSRRKSHDRNGESKTRDYSDTEESVRSKQSKKGHKPPGYGYSSYYEY